MNWDSLIEQARDGRKALKVFVAQVKVGKNDKHGVALDVTDDAVEVIEEFVKAYRAAAGRPVR